MSHHRDFYSSGVREALTQDCKDMRSDDSVTTAERLRQPLRDELKRLYQLQVKRRAASSAASSDAYGNAASRQQCDVDQRQPLIANLCAGAYFQDRQADGTRAQFREMLKPHGLGSRTSSRQGSINGALHVDPASSWAGTTASMSQRPREMPAPCHCAAPMPVDVPVSDLGSTSFYVADRYRAAAPAAAPAHAPVQPQSTSNSARIVDSAVVRDATAVVRPVASATSGAAAAAASAAAASSAPTKQQLFNQRRKQERARAVLAASRLGMTFPLRADAAAAANPAALAELRRRDEARRARESVPRLEVCGHKQQQQSEQQPQQPQQQYQQQQRQQTAPTSLASSQVNTGRSQVSNTLNAMGQGRVKGNLAFGQRVDLSEYQVPEAQRQRSAVQAQAKRTASSGPTTPTAAELVARLSARQEQQRQVQARPQPAVPQPQQQPQPQQPQPMAAATAVSSSGVAAAAAVPAYMRTTCASDNYTSIQRSQQRSASRNAAAGLHVSPARGSLEQYTRGLYIDGERVMLPHQVPKVGSVDINAIVRVPYRHAGGKAQPTPAPAASTISRAFYY